MARYEFFYADLEASIAMMNWYNLNEWVHANNGVMASRLRGGMLTDCNLRVTYLPHPQQSLNYRQEDQDYKNQQLIIFDTDLYFKVLDKFHIGDYAQLLMSPVNNIEDYGLDSIIRAAREDFRSLVYTSPVATLDNRAWKQKVAIIPGKDAKDSPRKGFMTEF